MDDLLLLPLAFARQTLLLSDMASHQPTVLLLLRSVQWAFSVNEGQLGHGGTEAVQRTGRMEGWRGSGVRRPLKAACAAQDWPALLESFEVPRSAGGFSGP